MSKLDKLTEIVTGLEPVQLRLAALKREGCQIDDVDNQVLVEGIQQLNEYTANSRQMGRDVCKLTAVPARTAGVREVWVASPRASQLTLAAAAVAGADFVLCAGGAQAITALAFGTDSVSPVGVITGPGNRWVTAAKQRVSGRVGIDMLAGPSELLVVADGSADPSAVAADLLAQAEHDVEARVGLLSLEPALLDAVDQELSRQLQTLPTADVASESVSNNGFAAHVPSLDVAVTVSDRLAPEHLHLNLQDASAVAGRFGHYGGIFVGPGSAEVFGDYGLGPNHTLPTCGTGRHRGGLSVFDYMACRTFLRLDEASEALDDARAFAELEGLHAHARSARSRFGRR